MKRNLWLLILMIPINAWTTTRWVSPTGTAAWASCVGSTPLSGTSACSLATANTNAASGDLVYLRAGSYTTGITPSHSGTGTSLPSTFIIFSSYTGETATLTGSSDQIDLTARSYVSIRNITFSDTTGVVYRIEQGANHNEITGCTFNSSNGYGVGMLLDTDGSGNWVTHNWIHGNTFITTGQAHGNGGTGCTDGGGDTLDVGVAYGTFGQTSENDNYNTIENNVFEHSPHASIESYGMYTVIRNNVFDNEPWSSGCPTYTNPPSYTNSAYNGKFGHRNMTVDDDYTRVATYMLIEGNRSGYAGVNDTNDGADNFTIGAPQNIVRYNFSYGAMNPGLMYKWGWNYGNGSGGNGGTYNRVYNNTLYNNGLGYPDGYTCGLSTCPWPQTNMVMYSGSQDLGNVTKNNIMYTSSGYTHFGSDVLNKGGPGNEWATLASGSGTNLCTGTQTGGDLVSGGAHGCSVTGDPSFTNPDLSNPLSTTLPDLSLQSGSIAIDAGTWLTTATNSGGGSTTLTVADALYFQDGTWGSDLARASAGLGGTMQADWIAIGTVSNIVQISSISYGTYSSPAGTITLASSMTWSNGAHIWLYKKSDGVTVLNGTAPDLGASEYSSGGPTGTYVKGVVKGYIP